MNSILGKRGLRLGFLPFEMGHFFYRVIWEKMVVAGPDGLEDVMELHWGGGKIR